MRFRLILAALILCHHYSLIAQSGTTEELPIKVFESKGKDDALIIYISGDGGWNMFSQSLTKQLVEIGFNTIVLDSYKYFYDEKSPARFANDIETIAQKYLTRWNKEKIIIVGYSFGADVAAFLPQQLSDSVKEKLKFITLLSPSVSTDFEIRFTDMLLSNGSEDRKYKITPVLTSPDIPTMCIFGKDERNLLKDKLKKDKNLFIVDVPGSHQYNDDVVLLSNLIRDFKM